MKTNRELNPLEIRFISVFPMTISRLAWQRAPSVASREAAAKKRTNAKTAEANISCVFLFLLLTVGVHDIAVAQIRAGEKHSGVEATATANAKNTDAMTLIGQPIMQGTNDVNILLVQSGANPAVTPKIGTWGAYVQASRIQPPRACLS